MGGMHAHVILAAGQGTRMRSRLPKVLHPLLGKPMLLYALEAALALKPERLVVVVGHGGEKVVEALEGYPVEVAWQKEQLGTAHALLQTEGLLRDPGGHPPPFPEDPGGPSPEGAGGGGDGPPHRGAP